MRQLRLLSFALVIAVPTYAQGDSSCPSGPDDVRLAALSGLAQMEPDQVLPVMKKILERHDVCSIPLRRQVLGYLYRSRNGDQTDLLLNVARTDPSGEVRRSAVQMLAQTNTDRAVGALDSLVFASGDMELRDAALRALSQVPTPSARASLHRAAEQGSLPLELRTRAVGYMGNSRHPGDDTQFLTGLYGKADQPELRDALLRAIGSQHTPESTNWLLGLARDRNRDIEVRRQAMSAVAQAVRPNETGNTAGIDLTGVLGLYDSFAGQVEMQDRVLDVIAQRPEPAATDKLLQIARTEGNAELRRKAILRVGQRRDPRVRDFLLEVLSK